MALWWPRSLLAPRKATPVLVPMSGSGGLGDSAVEEFKAGSPFWQITLDEIPLASNDQKRAWRAIAGTLNGRLGAIAVPIYDTDGAPWPGALRKPQDPAFADSQLFSNALETSGNVIVASCVGGAAAGATAISILMTTGADLRLGMHFSVRDRLYGIDRAVLGSPAIWHCTISPPVRETIFDGDSINFDDPRCYCRLATDAEMHTPDDYAGRTLAKVVFREAVTEVPPGWS